MPMGTLPTDVGVVLPAVGAAPVGKPPTGGVDAGVDGEGDEGAPDAGGAPGGGAPPLAVACQIHQMSRKPVELALYLQGKLQTTFRGWH